MPPGCDDMMPGDHFEMLFMSSATASSHRDERLFSSTPATTILHLFTGISIFVAELLPTAAAASEVISPNSESAHIMPTGPIIKSASLHATETGFRLWLRNRLPP